MNLTDYIQDSRKGKKAHHIEREAMRNAFLSEALEGFEMVSGDHAEAIRRMQQQIANRSQSKGRSIMFRMSMAASVALVIGVGWYFYFRFEVSSLELYETQLSEIMTTDTMKSNETIAMTEPTVQPDMKEAAAQENVSRRKAISLSQPMQHAESDLEIVNDEGKIDEMIKENQAEVAPEPIIPKVEESSKATRQVQGKVVDETGEPLPGVSIIVKNTVKGTVTDVNGEFALNTDVKTILQASFVGYEMKEFIVDTSKLFIAMHESAAQLDEVVVVGYGTQSKRSTTGAMTAVSEQVRKIAPEPLIGKRAYQKYLRENVTKPVDGECVGVKGKVQVRFNVNTAGKPSNFQILSKLCDEADREAIRLIVEGCDWTQGNTEATVIVEFR